MGTPVVSGTGSPSKVETPSAHVSARPLGMSDNPLKRQKTGSPKKKPKSDKNIPTISQDVAPVSPAIAPSKGGVKQRTPRPSLSLERLPSPREVVKRRASTKSATGASRDQKVSGFLTATLGPELRSASMTQISQEIHASLQSLNFQEAKAPTQGRPSRRKSDKRICSNRSDLGSNEPAKGRTGLVHNFENDADVMLSESLKTDKSPTITYEREGVRFRKSTPRDQKQRDQMDSITPPKQASHKMAPKPKEAPADLEKPAKKDHSPSKSGGSPVKRAPLDSHDISDSEFANSDAMKALMLKDSPGSPDNVYTGRNRPSIAYIRSAQSGNVKDKIGVFNRLSTGSHSSPTSFSHRGRGSLPGGRRQSDGSHVTGSQSDQAGTSKMDISIQSESELEISGPVIAQLNFSSYSLDPTPVPHRRAARLKMSMSKKLSPIPQGKVYEARHSPGARNMRRVSHTSTPIGNKKRASPLRASKRVASIASGASVRAPRAGMSTKSPRSEFRDQWKKMAEEKRRSKPKFA